MSLSYLAKQYKFAILAVTLLLAGGFTACSKTQTVDTFVNEAKQYQAKGDNKTAIIQLKNALQKAPDNADARFLLGSLYIRIGDVKSAEKELRRALSLNMEPAKVLPELGTVLLAQGQFQQVLDETNAIAGENKSAVISTLRGNAYLSLGKKQASKEAFEQALKNQPDYSGALMGLSRHALVENNIDAAFKFSERAVSQNPQDPDAWLFKGDLLRTLGKSEQALAAYEQVIKINPESNPAHLNKAFLQIANGQFEVAKLEIDAARKTNPGNLLIYYTQALLDFRQGKSALALESLQQVLRVAPEHLPSLLLAGAVQYSLGSMPQAELHLKKYLEKDMDNLYARKLLASTLMKSAQTKSAINILTPAIKDNPSDVQLLALAGEAYMQTGDYSQATEYFSKASAIAPKAAELHTALGVSKLALGENSSATAEMETAVKLDTQSPNAGVMLSMTQLRLKNYDKALAAAKTLEKSQADNPLVHNLKGAAYLGKNNIADARTSYEKALAIQPNNFPAAVNLAQLDVNDKKPDLAKQRFESMLAKDKKNIQIMNALAMLAIAQGQTGEATRWLELSSQENPQTLGASLQLILHYLRIGEKQKALTLAKKIQGSNSSDPDFLDTLAQAQFANDDKLSALDSYTKLATLRPDTPLVYFRIASLHMAMQHLPEAADALKKALSLQPDYLDAQLAMASVESERGNNDKALSIARQIQKRDSKSPVGFELEGNLLMRQAKHELAAKAYEQAMSIHPASGVLIKLHAALSQAGKENQADTRLSHWLKDNPADIEARMYQAGIYLNSQQNNSAMEQYQAILKQAPNFVPAINNLAWIFQQQHDARALEYAEKANKLAPDSAATLDTLGWILAEQGNAERGVPLLEKALKLSPQDAEIHYHYALGILKSGDKVKARKEIEQILASGKNFPKAAEARALLNKLL